MQDIDIAGLMAALGPFERTPVVAAAISGGSDSTALGLLLADWVKASGGRLHVLTVDHGLRPESADECERVARRFAAIPGCSAHVLRWQGNKPASALQAAARAARYQLLTEWCRARGVLHLAVGHTADDQAETVALRRAHGSGAAGLAGMAAARPDNGVRLLRPLLAVSRAALRAWLTVRGEGWIEDPSNQATRFERVRVRQRLRAGEAGALLAEAAQRGQGRAGLERTAARLLAEAGQIHEGGYASIAALPLLRAAPRLQAAVLGGMLLAISGEDYAPAAGDLLAVLGRAAGRTGSAQTLGGCIVQIRQGHLAVCREAAAAKPIPVWPGWIGAWDRRFRLAVDPSVSAAATGWTIAPLGEVGLRQAVDRYGIRLRRHPMPLAARLALPALWQGEAGGEQVVAQPHLMLGEGLVAWLQPRHAVTTCGFTVATGQPHTIYSSVLG